MKRSLSLHLLLSHLFLILLILLYLPQGQVDAAPSADCQPNATTNVTCTGTDTNGTKGTIGNDTITVNTGASVTDTSNVTVNGLGGTDTVVNNGTISNSNASSGKAVKVDSGTVTNNASGNVNATGNQGTGVFVVGTGTVNNSGNITASGTSSDGVNMGGGTVNNNGTITASGGSNSNGIVSCGCSTVTVINNGTINASAGDNGVNGKTFDMNVTNNGNIQGATNGVNLGSGTVTNNAGATMSGNTGAGVNGKNGSSNVSVINSGTITGNTGIDVETGHDSVTLNSGSTTTGTGGKAVVMGQGNDTVTVKPGAVVNGEIKTNKGNDQVVIGAGAKITSVVNGGADFDTLAFTFEVDLTGLNPASGTLTYAGQTYTWLNFEQLLVLLASNDGGGSHGPQVFFRNDNVVGLMSNNALFIEVVGKPGLIARLPFAVLKALAKGESARFEEPNTGGWFVRVFNMGPYHLNPSWTYYQVNLYDGGGNLISDQQGFALENK